MEFHCCLPGKKPGEGRILRYEYKFDLGAKKRSKTSDNKTENKSNEENNEEIR